jgi:hypothetical protein
VRRAGRRGLKSQNTFNHLGGSIYANGMTAIQHTCMAVQLVSLITYVRCRIDHRPTGIVYGQAFAAAVHRRSSLTLVWNDTHTTPAVCKSPPPLPRRLSRRRPGRRTLDPPPPGLPSPPPPRRRPRSRRRPSVRAPRKAAAGLSPLRSGKLARGR